MNHLRIVSPSERVADVLRVLEATPSVFNIAHVPNAAVKPKGDLVLCDVAREDTSVVIAELRELGLEHHGSISIEEIETAVSDAARAATKAAPGAAADAVVWEEVEERTSESAELSASFLVFMVLATLIAACGILTDSQVLIIGAMVVGPEFGPLAGLCVAIVQRRKDVARRSLTALAVGFPVGITAACLFALLVRAVDLTPEDFVASEHPLTDFISHPDAFSFIVACFAGTAGVLSLTSAKSGALIGVLVSVTTIPAAANIGVAAAYGEWHEWGGAMLQLAVNLTAIVLAGLVTLFVQRVVYMRRRRAHLHHRAREVAGLPIGRSRRVGGADYQRSRDG
jgi:uncharacterized hydrophobic protein (TIGR00271 family)